MKLVVVLGASSNPSRYSNMAMRELKNRGHQAVPVHPRESLIEGEKVWAHLSLLPFDKIDTLTMYVSAALSSPMTEAIIKLAPKRVIFNPGSENPTLQKMLSDKGIEVLEACTLVMLRTGQF
jgi:predicted CoA-binding protein